MSGHSTHPDFVHTLLDHLLERVFDDPVKLRKLALSRLRVLDHNDIAYLMNWKDVNTVRKWHKEQRNGFRMNEGPDGSLTMRWEDFGNWYSETYHKPAPRL